MTEWGVVLVIVTLLGFVSGIIAPLIKLNTTIVKLIDSVEALDKSLAALKESNSEKHEKLFGRLEEHGKMLFDHEARLKRIEEDEEKER